MSPVTPAPTEPEPPPGSAPETARETAQVLGFKTTTALIERVVAVFCFGVLLIGVAMVLRPFVTGILFGTILVVATWPFREWLIDRGVPSPVTATLLLAAALAIIGVPALSLAPGLGERLVEGFQRVQAYLVATPELPSFLANLPFVSETLAELWKALADPASAFQTFIQPYSSELRRALVEVARAFAEGIFQLLVALAVATMFWLRGDTLAIAVKDVAERLGGSAAGDALHTAADSVRGIAYGIVGTAALQGLAMGIGLFIAGVPGAGLLGFLTMVIALSQFGILLVVIWGGAAWWLFSIGSPGWSIFIVVWGLLVSTVDNFIRPWLVSFGAPLPITLIVLGVFGGFLAFGFLGLFIGPTLLGVFFSLLQGWRALPKPVGLLGVPEDDADGPGRA